MYKAVTENKFEGGFKLYLFIWLKPINTIFIDYLQTEIIVLPQRNIT